MPRKVEISHKTILFTVWLLISLWFLYFIRDILFQLFVSLFIMVLLNPTVKKLSKLRVPRAVSVLIVYFSALGLIIFSLANIIPALVDQTSNFVRGLPTYLADIGVAPFISNEVASQLLSELSRIPGEIVRFGVSIFSNIITVLTVLIFGFYLLMSRDKLEHQLENFLGHERGDKLAKVIDDLETQLGGWARGQLSLMFVVGLANYIGFTILGIPYALPLAIFAGLMEAVPYVGATIAAIPAVIIGFGISSVMGFAVIALAFLIQQLENYVFVPKVMERSVGLNPVITLLALAIGFRLAGIAGVLMGVPVVITLRVLMHHYFNK
jgi:predicted PurR-regulated permease PerM